MNAATFKEGKYVTFSKNEIKDLKMKAQASSTGRFRYCLHQSHEDKIQEMIIGMESSSYCRPHSHPKGISESYSIIEGSLLVLFFDDNGIVNERITLQKDGIQILRINSSIIHMPIATSKIAIYHETLTGPFEKEKVVRYSHWSPEEDDFKSSSEYLQSLKRNYE